MAVMILLKPRRWWLRVALVRKGLVNYEFLLIEQLPSAALWGRWQQSKNGMRLPSEWSAAYAAAGSLTGVRGTITGQKSTVMLHRQ
jgi:hypothetical protein